VSDAGDEQLVVTLDSLGEIGRPEAVVPPGGPDGRGVHEALLLNRYRRVLELLETEAGNSDPKVLFTAQDRDASLLQARILSEAQDSEALPAGGKEVKFGKGLEDPWGWVTSLLDWVDRLDAHDIIRPAAEEPEPEPLPPTARVAMAADWATGMYGAPVTAETIASQGTWDLLMHLGDVYYAGTVEETAKRFTKYWPTKSATVNRAINGNHEMYSGGYGYFDHILPAFNQEASYFAHANDDWLLVGLDTAWLDHDMDDQQVGWLNRVLKNAGDGRKLVLFSHQQPFSRLGAQGPKLVKALHDLLHTKAVTAWYWGHEHGCIVYDAHPEYGLLGRCLGNGGIPEKRYDEARDAPSERDVAGVSWRRLEANDAAPSCLVLDGPNQYITGKENKFLPHGYMTLSFEGKVMTERIHLPDGTEIFSNEITA
jgi:hypothetical protein